MTDYGVELEFAKKLAKDCAAVANCYYRGDCDVTTKKDLSPVTEADMAINWQIIQAVSQSFPDHGVIGEEQSWNEDAELLWVCDPIDGTVAFIHRIPTAMVSLALVDNSKGLGRPVMAVAINPFTEELYWASLGNGAYLDGRAIKVSAKKWGRNITLAGSSSPVHHPNLLDDANISRQLFDKGIRLIHPIGAVIKGCSIAEGGIDGTIFTNQHNYDLAAIALIVTEAGGQVTDCAGKPVNFNEDIDSAIFSNGLIHDKLLALYKEVQGC